MVTLHRPLNGGGGDDDIHVLYDDNGVPNAAPYDMGLVMQPSGPGTLFDFSGANLDDTWTLTVVDSFGGGVTGILNEWCLRVNSGCPVPGPSDLTCVEGPTGVELQWTNNGAYVDVDIVRNGVVIDTASGTSTSYTDTTPLLYFNYTYRVIARSSAPVCSTPSQNCKISIAGYPTIQVCETTNLPIDDTLLAPQVVRIATIAQSTLITDTQVEIHVTHSFLSDLQIDISSPTMTTVRLHDEVGRILRQPVYALLRRRSSQRLFSVRQRDHHAAEADLDSSPTSMVRTR